MRASSITGASARPSASDPGPIGVRHTRDFDPLVQYLAAGGIAVLQVNYRGSRGRGKSFLDAGKRQFGTGIEDDLDAAVDLVAARGWVDGERICVAGGSYGGYSALMSVARHPDRYRCAASLNGPTDLNYLHTRYQHSEGFREFFEEYIGDPEDEDALREISPAYRAAEIQVPVLLIHGTEDKNVDVDHFYRMRTMLERYGKVHEAHLMLGAGHSPNRMEWMEFAGRLRAFLLPQLE